MSDAIPFPDASIDAVLAVNALHFSADPHLADGEVRRVLRPGGRLLIFVQPVWLAPGARVGGLGEELTAQLTRVGFGPI